MLGVKGRMVAGGDVPVAENESVEEEGDWESRGISDQWMTWALVGLVILILLVGGVTYLFAGGNSGGFDLGTARQRVLGESSTEPDQQPVNMNGVIEDIVDARVFTLSDPELLGDNKLLVISPGSLRPPTGDNNGFPFQPGDQISILGEVRKFDSQVLGRELGMDLSNEKLIEFEGRPVLVIESIQKQ
ncbi:MAG: hypothetical protein Q7S03_03585 [bacterium]|nr:hypothetical protein [bacterium]